MQALNQLLSGFIAFVPNLLGAIVVLAVGYIGARLITSLIKRLLVLVGVDKLTERLQAVDVVANADLQLSLSTALARILFYFIMLVVLVAATDVLGLAVVSNLVASAIEYIPNLLAAMVILVFGAILADVLKEIATVTCRSLAIPAANMIGSIVFWFVFIAILISALSQAQLETDFIVANLSILLAGLSLAFALAYGLAAKPLMGGFLAQFYNRGKFNVGDRISIADQQGLIISIDRASMTLSHDGQLIIVPLSKLQEETVRVLERADQGDPLLGR